jgi:hypothetical protein
MKVQRQVKGVKTEYTSRRECVAKFRAKYTKLQNHPLVFSRKNNNAHHFHLVCKVCERPIVSGAQSKDPDKPYFYEEDHKAGQFHTKLGGVPGVVEDICLPTSVDGQTKSTIKQLTGSLTLNVAVDDQTSVKARNRRVSTVALQAQLVAEGHGDVTISAIKQAAAALKVTALQHMDSYNKVIPYFEQLRAENPTLKFDVQPEKGGTFERLIVVMPYAEAFIPNMLNVFGLDAGFMPEIPLKGTYQEYAT